MAQSEPETMTGATFENDDDIAVALYEQMNAEELRRLAAHIPAVSRPRGATKLETAEAIVDQAPEAAKNVAEGGDFDVACTCGLSFSVGSAAMAKAAAENHKSDNPTHFPTAKDGRDGSGLYGC